ncbi:hypothetical protein VNI00_007830 [Paramarasmius palmivorus]|uniref:FAD-binding PCMH-type domain-containing protein n=1 Tax=Paramarasmius palmivorus TaxID=297713 RepID=A0AAW0D157_9AGAR
MDPIFLNKSCDPFDSRDTPCRIGAYVQYAVNVSKPEHVVKTVQFVKDHNIRLVVKNTGHDYMGRSTGTGAVSVWMHHLTDVVWIPDYKSNQYSGPAFQVSAGVRGIDLVKVASLKGLAIVSGECPVSCAIITLVLFSFPSKTVGFAGGYIQGGGHSALSSFYGLAADQSLEFEVITTEGQFLVASPTENEDLYWALSGGGGGTYGIVWSVTIKAHPDLPVTVAFLDFSSTGVSQEDYWAAIRSHSAATPAFSDSKVFSFTTITSTSFTMSPMFAVNKTTEQVTTLVEPIRQALDGLGMDFNLTIRTLDNYLDAYEAVASFANIPIANILSNTRLMPPSIWEDEITFNQYVDTLRTIINAGAVTVDTVLKPSLEVAGHPSNAVLPAWREISHMTMLVLPLVDGGPLDQITRDMDRITNQLDPLLVELAPDTGAYLNEADPNEPDFKRTFYGANYDRLLHIKDKYDPLQILYGSIAVGGDRWEEVENGRLCRTNVS